MADPYIDPWETQAYGAFAVEQMQSVCLRLIPKLEGMVHFAIGAQLVANQEMKEALDRQPQPVSGAETAVVVEEARDSIVRLGKYLESIKGHPLDPALVFRGGTPSMIAKRRLVKLTASLKHIIETLQQHKADVRDAKLWIDELKAIDSRLETIEQGQRSNRVESAMLRPELVAARERWLATYVANKSLITGLLRHAGKLHLLPLIFDDLAETHRASGVSDRGAPEAPEPSEPSSPHEAPGSTPT